MKLATGAFVAGTAVAVILGAVVTAIGLLQGYAAGSPRSDKAMAILAVLAAVAAALSWFLGRSALGTTQVVSLGAAALGRRIEQKSILGRV